MFQSSVWQPSFTEEQPLQLCSHALASTCFRRCSTRSFRSRRLSPAASTSWLVAFQGRPSVRSAMATNSRGESWNAILPFSRGCSRSAQS